MAEDLVIRPEQAADHSAVDAVVRGARFGFERASSLGFIAPHPKIPDAAFMVRRLPGYSPKLAGRIVYPAAFDALGY